MIQPYITRLANPPMGYIKGVVLTYTKHSTYSESSPTVDPSATVKPDNVLYGDTIGNQSANISLLTPTMIIATTSLRGNNSATPFSLISSADFRFEISSTGVVSVVQRLNGSNVGGLPPIVFQGVCEGGFIFGHVGNISHVITMKMVPYTQSPPT